MASEAVNTVNGPEVCPMCDGEGYVIDRSYDNEWTPFVRCPHCQPCCVICGSSTDVIGGECGQCADQADAYAVRAADR